MDSELHALLKPLRERIDAIDVQLLALLNQRAQLALEVGTLKQGFDAPVFQPEREMQVIARLQKRSQGPLHDAHIAVIWRQIMAAHRALEKKLTAAFLGPAGTYSEQAMYAYFGEIIEGAPCLSIDDVFRLVETNTADFGIVPLENSNEGAVSRTLDLLLQTPLMISGEISLPISHNLLTRTGNLQGVTRICAHAQALAQCQHWLSIHAPHVAREAVASNAQAAQMAAKDLSIAAIASERAATCYDLRIAHAKIQDDPHNRTRFVVLGGALPEATGNDQTSLIFSAENQPGAVYRMLEPLARHQVTMTRLESRPAKSGAWEYYFYIDVEGHRTDAPVAAALAELEQEAAFIKILGSYPRAQVSQAYG